MTGPVPESPQDLAAAYALGALPDDEARRFEAYLASSPEAQREVAEYREAAALLALAGSDAVPPAGLRERVLARLGERPGPAPRESPARHSTAPIRTSAPRGGGIPWLALAACVLLAVGLGAALLSARSRLASVETELAAREQALAQTRQQLTEREATLDAILEPGVQLVQLTASGDPDPGMQLFWNRQRNRAIVHGYRLKPVPAGQAYQLWFIKDGKPVPSVTFRPESDGHAKVEEVPVPAGGSISAAAVTIEPDSGSTQPTSPIVMVGALPKS
ncbi:MAG TPA: anti-sigma factor [Gemmatimonadales bacterium]|nr:anti-sigma factor [Gemmatimonadales bacterium]